MKTFNADVFKHILFRISGESIDNFTHHSELYNTIELKLNQILYQENAQSIRRIELCDNLFQEIKTNEGDKEKRALINIRRSIYNGRKLPTNLIRDVQLGTCESMFNEYLLRENEIVESRKEFELLFSHTEKLDKDLVVKISSSNNIKNGILLSSETFYKYIEEFEGKNIRDNTILGLYKYVTRTVTKTSPFSTFTQLNTGILVENCGSKILIKKKSATVTSYVKYNNYIFYSILNVIVNKSFFFDTFRLSLNCSLKKDGNLYLYFTNINNLEAFQKLNANNLIDFIIDSIPIEGIKFKNLIELILPEIDDSIPEIDVIIYIYNLIITGLLEVDINLFGLDENWNESLLSFIEGIRITDDRIEEICEVLRSLNTKKESYSRLPPTRRYKTIIEMRKLFQHLFVLLDKIASNEAIRNSFIKSDQNNALLRGINISNTLPPNIIYEDSTLDVEIFLDKKYVSTLITAINTIFNSFSFLCSFNGEKNIYNIFYEYKYEANAVVPLLTFYEDLYKDEFFAQESSKYMADENLQQHIEKVISFFRENSELIENINLHLGITESIISLFQKEFSSMITPIVAKSYSAFLQFYTNNNSDEMKCVLSGGVLPGNGKMFSRFLHVLSNSVTEDLREWNIKSKKEDTIFAENSDSSYFNANLHPSLLPYEIKMPGATNRPGAYYLNVHDLHIVRSDKGELELLNNSGEKVYIFDLGFQNPYHRSKLHRLLSSFGHNLGYPYFIINSIFNKIYSQEIEFTTGIVTIFPRIVFFNTIVFQRKYWVFPIFTLNSFKEKRNSFDLTHQIYSWRKEFSIPSEVFVRISHDGKSGNRTINKDDYKPQYINFLSPISIRLFIKLISNVDTGKVTIEEMLPNTDQLLDIDGKRHVTEILIQWQ